MGRPRPDVLCIHSIKKAYPTSEGSNEHIWIEVISFEAGEFAGAIANRPVRIPDLKYNDKVRVRPDEISDWMFHMNGEIVGGRTIKVLWDRATPQERAERFGGLRFRAQQSKP